MIKMPTTSDTKIWVYACLTLVLFLGGCSSSPYEILRRTEDANGLVVNYRVSVPDNHTREDLKSWCNEITDGEGGSKVVNIEFVDSRIVSQQKGMCVSGTLYTVGDLNKMPGQDGR